jgi:regulatory protein
MNQRPNTLTPAQAWEKMKGWCAYQERCQQEVYQKLRQAGLNAMEADTIIARLIEENYLNEERYAIQFAGGHFRQKKWGRQKILYALRQKQISEYCIKKAMQQIPEADYDATLVKLATAKWNAVKTATPAQRWAKTKMYLLQKGYASSDVLATLQSLQQK